MARILVVDDVKFIAGMIGSTLENAGHDVTIAVSGEEALKKAKEILPNLILLDLMMPGLDGLEVARLLKSDSTTHPIPVMMISAKNDLNTVAEAFAADLEDHPDAQVTILPELTHPFVRISEPDWTQITADDIGDEVDQAAIDALVYWLYR